MFLENYNIALAQAIIPGCDIWLNTPRRPHEASGTSGMKAAVNGVPNLSVLDGWWAEAYDPSVGWALAGESDEADAARALSPPRGRRSCRASHDRAALGRADEDARSRGSRRVFSMQRAVIEYAERYYLPASRARADR